MTPAILPPLHPGIDSGCAVCHATGVVVERDGERGVASPCACIGPCTRCRGTGWVASGPEARARRMRCGCQELLARVQRFNDAAIPGRHSGSLRTPESFRPYRGVMPAMAAISRFLKAFKISEENRGLILHGDVGRGKTHLMVAALRELVLVHGATARFVEFSHLLADIKTGFDRGDGPAALIEPLVKVDVLGIDELGKGRNTEFEGTVLDELVSRRYNAGRTILATTNFAPGPPTGRPVGDLVTEERPALVDRVSPRVYSRLREVCDFCALEGEDYRERIWARESTGPQGEPPARPRRRGSTVE